MSADRGCGPVARVLLAAVGFYSRAISPALPPRCRFAPTCSAYAAEAVAVHGAGRGSWLALRRLLKCAPWHPGGFDPVPPRAGRHATGTGGAGRPSRTAALPVPAADGARRPAHETPPASRRAPQEESSLA
ncbi:membrane protein insertion efficiency factor YidD [Geodermatophilus maliterrae]|uniref:Putative membrane protein insertion efficiency factor n=1 Tax=Geodermatophilus maliterrae TaxID=3162531 RepID=A0ABV3XI08_9ACTN